MSISTRYLASNSMPKNEHRIVGNIRLTNTGHFYWTRFNRLHTIPSGFSDYHFSAQCVELFPEIFIFEPTLDFLEFEAITLWLKKLSAWVGRRCRRWLLWFQVHWRRWWTRRWFQVRPFGTDVRMRCWTAALFYRRLRTRRPEPSDQIWLRTRR